MPFSTTAQAMRDMAELGWEADIVERRIARGRVTKDLFGFIDLVALDGEPGIMGIQVTSGSNHASRRTKSLAEPRFRKWVAAGNRIEIWSYAKKGARGEKKVMTLRRERLGLDNLEE